MAYRDSNADLADERRDGGNNPKAPQSQQTQNPRYGHRYTTTLFCHSILSQRFSS